MGLSPAGEESIAIAVKNAGPDAAPARERTGTLRTPHATAGTWAIGLRNSIFDVALCENPYHTSLVECYLRTKVITWQ
jgi:hypothetical protein